MPGSSNTATFDSTGITKNLTFSATANVGGWTFNDSASNYNFTSTKIIVFHGAGIVINGGSVTITNNSNEIDFLNSSTAGSAAITNNNLIQFFNSSTAGSATITNNKLIEFSGTSTAGSASITAENGATTAFTNTSSGGTAQLIANAGGVVDFSNLTSSGTTAGSFAGAGAFRLGSKALTVGGNNLSTVVTGTIEDGGSAGGSGAQLIKAGTGTLTLSGTNTYTGGTTVAAGGALILSNSSALGTGDVSLNGGTVGVTVNFDGSLTIANNFTGSGDPTYNVSTANATTITGQISGSGDVVVDNGGAGYTGTLVLSNTSNDYTGPTTVDGGTLKAGAADVFGNNSAMTVASGATLDLGGFGQALGSLAGAGTVMSSAAGSVTLTTGADNTSTTFSGVIQDGSGTVALSKTGTGYLTLSGTGTYSGATTVNAGTLSVNGDISLSGGVTVNNGGILGGTGTVSSTTVDSGGALAPGNSIGTITVSGNLTFNSGSSYNVEVSPSAADRTNVTGTATLAGTVNATYQSGTSISKQYTILNATGGVSGTFDALANTSLPSNVSAALSYDANNVYLDLTLSYTASGGLDTNQQNVANALTGYFNTTGSISTVFSSLSSNGLSQVAGESGAGVQQMVLPVRTCS